MTMRGIGSDHHFGRIGRVPRWVLDERRTNMRREQRNGQKDCTAHNRRHCKAMATAGFFWCENSSLGDLRGDKAFCRRNPEEAFYGKLPVFAPRDSARP